MKRCAGEAGFFPRKAVVVSFAVSLVVFLLALLSLLSVAGCSGEIYERRSDADYTAPAPAIFRTPDGAHAMEISVLIYNVEGLPWPIRWNRKAKLRKITTELKQLKDEGRAPDFVMLQEAFTKEAAKIARDTGYANVIAGPDRSTKRHNGSADIPREFRKGRKLFRGERFGKFLNSGLYILTDFTVIDAGREPFSRRACAGFDCLSNKGILFVRAQIKGLPTTLDLFTTHMNSKEASGVKITRANSAHQYQVDEIAIALEQYRIPEDPFIFAGDFNMKNSPNRLDYFTYQHPYSVVRHYCTVLVQDCRIKMSWDGDEPWLDTQDLQFFGNGQTVRIRPVQIEAMFDEEYHTGKLSDHDGYLVTYRLSWNSK